MRREWRCSEAPPAFQSQRRAVTSAGMTNLIGGLPAFLSERQVMYRERAASMYAVLPFGIATGVVELPYLLTQALIFVPISYFMVGFRAEAGPLLLYVIIFTESIALYTFMVRPTFATW